MKKLLWAITALVLIGAIGAGSWYYLDLNQSVRRAVQRLGSDATGTQVTIERVNISAADGTGVISGLAVENPTGFRARTAVAAESIKITLELDTLGRGVPTVRTLAVVSPRISYEPAEKGNNLTALLEGMQQRRNEAGRKIIVDRIVIRDARLDVASPGGEGRTLEVPLPEIRMSSIGREAGGVTPPQLAIAVVETLLYHARRAVPSATPEPVPAKRAGK